MIKILRRILYGKPVQSEPCQLCGYVIYDGVCPTCFNAGRKWKYGKK